MDRFTDGTEHLLAELQRLELMLRRQVLRLRAANLLTADEFRGMYIADAQVDALLSHQIHAETGPGDDIPASTQALTLAIEQLRQENESRVQSSGSAGCTGTPEETCLPLSRLASLFSLRRFEVDVLLLCIAPELDLRYETLYAYVQNDVTRKRPSVGLALKLLCETVEERCILRESFAPESPLLRHHLVRLLDDPQDREPSLPALYLKTDQRVMDFLLDRGRIDKRLLPFTSRVEPAYQLGDLALPEELTRQLTHISSSLTEEPIVLFFHGPYGVGKQAAAEAICAELGRPLLVADVGQALNQTATANIPGTELSFAMTLALLRREATLQGAGLYLTHCEAVLAAETSAYSHRLSLVGELSSGTLPVFLGSEVPWPPDTRWPDTRFLSFEFPLPAFPLRLRLWQEALNRSVSSNGHRLGADVEVASLANKFVLSAGQIQDAVREVLQHIDLRTVEQRDITLADLHSAARSQSNQGLRRLAHKVEPVYTWADIVLPPRAMQQLREVAASVKHRYVVYTQWGFERKLALGKGLNVLFAGPSGTGKTMAAGIVARDLDLDLYKIDLSSVVSKYIGETEKNLSRIFNEAQSSNAILFFDEADAIFGKRSEIKDAHDRYANIEVAYLLQKMEEYEGIVILATNLSKNLDEAFARRIHHSVEFPFPDAIYRERIWRCLLPTEAPLADDVNLEFLAHQFELAGGNIRNVALAAAFLAAAEGDAGSGSAIRMEHLILATAREMHKLGKLPSKADFRDYYELIRERG